MDRYGHLYDDADRALADALDERLQTSRGQIAVKPLSLVKQREEPPAETGG